VIFPPGVLVLSTFAAQEVGPIFPALSVFFLGLFCCTKRNFSGQKKATSLIFVSVDFFISYVLPARFPFSGTACCSFFVVFLVRTPSNLSLLPLLLKGLFESVFVQFFLPPSPKISVKLWPFMDSEEPRAFVPPPT